MTSINADASLSVALDGLTVRIGQLLDRMDRNTRKIQQANEAVRQLPFIINVPLVSGAATLNPTPSGPDLGFYWSIRKIAAVGFTAGTVNLYIDSTTGEPIVPFPSSGVFTFGKGEQLIKPGSSIAVSASGITGTVQLWGEADQFESWLLPWYLSARA